MKKFIQKLSVIGLFANVGVADILGLPENCQTIAQESFCGIVESGDRYDNPLLNRAAELEVEADFLVISSNCICETTMNMESPLIQAGLLRVRAAQLYIESMLRYDAYGYGNFDQVLRNLVVASKELNYELTMNEASSKNFLAIAEKVKSLKIVQLNYSYDYSSALDNKTKAALMDVRDLFEKFFANFN